MLTYPHLVQGANMVSEKSATGWAIINVSFFLGMFLVAVLFGLVSDEVRAGRACALPLAPQLRSAACACAALAGLAEVVGSQGTQFMGPCLAQLQAVPCGGQGLMQSLPRSYAQVKRAFRSIRLGTFAMRTEGHILVLNFNQHTIPLLRWVSRGGCRIGGGGRGWGRRQVWSGT